MHKQKHTTQRPMYQVNRDGQLSFDFLKAKNTTAQNNKQK